MSKISEFIENTPSHENQWRAVILFGKNSASYKFALAKTLLSHCQNAPQTEISLQDLAKPFALNLCEHLKIADKQGTNGSSKFLEACRSYNQNQLGLDALIQTTVKLGFNNVLDAFHRVNQENIPLQFFVKNKRQGITITDDFSRLIESEQSKALLL